MSKWHICEICGDLTGPEVRLAGDVLATLCVSHRREFALFCRGSAAFQSMHDTATDMEIATATLTTAPDSASAFAYRQVRAKRLAAERAMAEEALTWLTRRVNEEAGE